MWKIPLPFVFISYFSIYPTIIKPPRTLGPAQQDKKFGYGPHVQISNESSWQWDEAQSWHQYLRSSIQAYLSPLFLSVCLFVCFFFNSPIDSYLKLWLWCCRWRQPSRGFARHQPFLLEHCFSSILQVSLSCNPSPIYRHSANPKFLPSLWEKRWIWKGDMESCNCKYITAC